MRSSNQLKFFIKCIVGCVIPLLAFSFYAHYYKMYYLDSIYVSWMDQKSYVNSSGHDNDYLVISDSLGKVNVDGAMLNENGISSYNISLGGSCPIEFYYSLKNYLKNGNKVRNIILILDIRHLEFAQGFNYQGLYDQFSMKDMLEIYWNAKKLKVSSVNTMTKDFAFNLNYINSMLGYKLYFPQYYLPSMINAGFYKRYSGNIKASSYLEEHYGSLFGSDKSSDEKCKIDHFYVNSLIDFYFDKFLNLAEENGIAVHFVVSPYPEGSQETISKEAEREYFEYFKNYSDKYSSLKVTNDSYWYLDSKYFGDPNHLTNAGKVPFTNYIKELLSL